MSATAAAAPASSGTRRGGIGRTPMDLSSLVYYNPNRPDSTEAIWQPQYDYQSYTTNGVQSLTFFQVPVGQGTTSAPGASGAKTYADTNLQLGGQFPAPTAFLCSAVMVVYFPAGNPSATGTAAAVASFWNDSVAVGSKVYLRDAPIGKFPPNFTINGVSSVALGLDGGTGTLQSATGFARAAGRYYEITPFLIPQSQNFNVSLYWPAAQAVSATGRIGVILDGFYYRQSQ